MNGAKHAAFRRMGVAWLTVCLLLWGGHKTGSAQVDDALWSQPVNLSHSGAGEAPVLVVGPERQSQVFWWDRFAGLTTSYVLDDAWSAPTPVPIQMPEVLGEGRSARVITSTVTTMPYIVGTGEMALALWLGVPDLDTGLRPLFSSRLRLGTVVWTAPELLVESATAWDVTSDSRGILHLIYCQTQQLESFAAGIYYMRSADGGATWSEPTALYVSLYARLWTAETAHLSIAVDATGNILVGWDDPRQESAFYTFSADGGLSWSMTSKVGDGEMVGLHPRLIAMPASSYRRNQSELVMLWEQQGVAATCVLLQQRSDDGGKTWSAASRVFEGLVECPVQILAAQTTMGLLLLMRGEEATYLLTAAWDGEQWSEIKRLSFSFEDPETGSTVYLEAIQANIISDNTLVVVGQDRGGDIWVLPGKVDALEWVFAPPSPWSSPSPIFESEGVLGFPAVATDAVGNTHALWSIASAAGQPGTMLYYSRSDQGYWSRPTAVLGAAEGMAQMPVLVFAEPFLHAVWSGGLTGTVFHSRSYPGDAYVASGWSVPSTLGKTTVGSAPAMTVDLLGHLHMVYAVPFNEGRGIYYVRTDDGGESWSDVVQIFDAVIEGWPSVDHPSVAVDEWGTVHVVWVRMSLPGYGLPQGVYYAQSVDRGKTWTDVTLLADGAYDWPQVAATLAGPVVVTWQDLERNIVEYRHSSDYGLTWAYVSQIPGLQTVEGRVALTQDYTGRVHIVALEPETGSGVTLCHLIYTGGQWTSLDSMKLMGIDAPISGGASSVVGELGLIDVVGLGHQRVDSELTSVLWHTRRTIESGARLEPNFLPVPTPTPTPGLTPAPTPTPRPVVNPYPPQSSARALELGPISLPLLALGGIGIAALFVGGLVLIKAAKR